MKIGLLNETKSFLFLFQQKKSERIFLVCFLENKGIMLQTLRRKQKYQVTNVRIEKIKLSRLLVQQIKEFKMNEIQCKTPQ